MEELEYWKLKAKMGQLRIEEIELQSGLTRINDERLKLMKEVELDINKKYKFNDELMKIEEIE